MAPLSLAWTHTDLVESPWPCRSRIHCRELTPHLRLAVVVALWSLHQHLHTDASALRPSHLHLHVF